MTRTLFRTNFNFASLCTYQLLFSLILWCSTSSKDSRDYKFVSFGSVDHPKLILQVLGVHRCFKLQLQTLYRTHVIFLHILVLHFTSFPEVFCLQNLAKQISRYEFCKFISISVYFLFYQILIQSWQTRGATRVAGTGSVSGSTGAVRFQLDRTLRTQPYRFG